MSERLTRTAKRRQALFDRGVTAWQAATGDLRGPYVCPLCARGFTKLALDRKMLTIEHVPPKAQGGRLTVLTCWDCNSKAGHTVDAAASARDRVRKLMQAVVHKKGTAKGHARLKIGEIETNVEFASGSDGITITSPKHLNSPGRTDAQFAFVRQLTEAGKSRELKMTFTPKVKFHVRYSQLGDLRSAFLGAFAAYGYRYSFHPRLAQVRRQLEDIEARVIPDEAWLLDPPNNLPNPSILGLTSPARGLAVRIGIGVVILPWIDGPPDLYQEISKAFDPSRRIELSGQLLDWPAGMPMVLDLPEDEPPGAAV